MLSLSLPFVFALLQVILLVRLLLPGIGRPPPQAALLFVAASASALTACVVGLRWGSATPWSLLARQWQPLMASTLPALAWLEFVPPSLLAAGSWRHGLPVLLIAASALWWRPPLDILLFLLFVAYGGALWQRGGVAEEVATARLEQSDLTRLLPRLVAGMLILSGVCDGLLALDFRLWQGLHAPAVVAVANLLLLPLSVSLILLHERLYPPSSAAEMSQPATSARQPTAPLAEGAGKLTDGLQQEFDLALFARLDDLLLTQAWCRDPDLTLQRLARKLGVPARQLSAAVNRQRGCNVSQLVNGYRVDAAKQLLRDSKLPVTEIQLASGFFTKSNFNREFLRLSGMSPSAYRRQFSATPAGENR